MIDSFGLAGEESDAFDSTSNIDFYYKSYDDNSDQQNTNEPITDETSPLLPESKIRKRKYQRTPSRYTKQLIRNKLNKNNIP